MEKTYSKEFAAIIEGKIEGVDYIVINEDEKRVLHNGEPGEPYEMDFTKMEIDARVAGAKIVVGGRGALYGAFDPATHTMILTANPHMIDVESYPTKCHGLSIPFGDQRHEPADPLKAAALNYQSDQRRRETDFSYGQHWPILDHSDDIAFLQAVLPTLKTAEDKKRVSGWIEQYAEYTVNSNGEQKGRNDRRAPYQVGQRYIIERREALNKKEVQKLALNNLDRTRGPIGGGHSR